MARLFAVTLLVEMPDDQDEAFHLADEISRATIATFSVDGQDRRVRLVDAVVQSDPGAAVEGWRQPG